MALENLKPAGLEGQSKNPETIVPLEQWSSEKTREAFKKVKEKWEQKAQADAEAGAAKLDVSTATSPQEVEELRRQEFEKILKIAMAPVTQLEVGRDAAEIKVNAEEKAARTDLLAMMSLADVTAGIGKMQRGLQDIQSTTESQPKSLVEGSPQDMRNLAEYMEKSKVAISLLHRNT